MRLQVIKVGGAALTSSAWLEQFAHAAAVSVADVHRIVVHGGGPEITELSAVLGITTEWHEGRRVTSEAALDVTTMVLNGRINKRLVRALRAHGIDAFGFSAQDGGIVRGRLAEGGALGRVGEVTVIRAELLRQLLGLGLVPVISPVSLGEDGGALNINADEVATAIAQQLQADELLFLTDVEGVRANGNGYAAGLSAHEAERLVVERIATGGMAVKLGAAVRALNARVPKVRIGGLEMLWNGSSGTALYAEEMACR